MKYYIIAGEASGDLHGSNLIKALKKEDESADIRCWGGDLMQAAGGNVVKHFKDLAFMGFVEVLFNLRTILRNLKFCKKDILQYHPDVLVLVDYPGFNLRIAAWAKERGIKVVFYISPQVWAWKESRVKKIKASVDKLLVILPFEKDFYKKHDYEVVYVGHPLLQAIDHFREEHQTATDSQQNKIALLPGSRKQEINANLSIMLEVTKRFPGYQFVIAQAPSMEKEFYAPFLDGYPNIELRAGAYEILMQSSAALVASGTATLETALFDVPQVVCYKANKISYEIGKRLIKVKYISLVNLIMDKEVVKELIQDDFNVSAVSEELQKLLSDENRRSTIFDSYHDLRNILSLNKNASANAAREIIKTANE